MSDFKPREIHDPEVLEAIIKECSFLSTHCVDEATGDAYNQMAISASRLRSRIMRTQDDNEFELTTALRVQWMRDQIMRDIEFFESKRTDWLAGRANEIWKESRNPDATRAKINVALSCIGDSLFRMRRLLSRKQPLNKGPLKPDFEKSQPQLKRVTPQLPPMPGQ